MANTSKKKYHRLLLLLLLMICDLDDLLILTTYQLVYRYFMPRSQRITFLVCSYFHFLCSFFFFLKVLYIYIYIYIWSRRPRIRPRSRHTKDFKMVLDTSLLNIQLYKVCIKGEVEQFRERSSTLPYTLV